MRTLASLILAGATLAASLGGAQASPQPQAPDLTRVYPNESYAQYYYGRRYYGPGYYYRRNNGAAVAAGVAGLAAGALIAGAIANQAQAAPPPPPATVDPQLAAWCARRYRSYDPVSGTFLARSGERIVCTY